MATAQLKSNMTINVSCVTHLICVTFKTLQRNICKKGTFIIEPFCSSNSTVLLSRCQDISSFFHLCPTKIDEEDAKTCR